MFTMMSRLALVGILIFSVGGSLPVWAGDQPKKETPGKEKKPEQGTPAPNYVDLGQQMIKALKASPGCLGVEIANTASGKGVIFAWFKDKKACLDWYYGDTHQKIMKSSFPGKTFGKPLRNVPDDCGPIMAIASITFSQKPMFEGTTLPFSQISIELYTPLKGGLSAGGTFAPPGIEVPKIKSDSSKKK